MKKNLKKIFFLVLLTTFSTSFAEEKTTYLTSSSYQLYKDEVTNFCSVYKKDSELIVTLNESKYFKDLWNETKNPWNLDALVQAKQDYSKNMDTIYDCATYTAYYRGLKLIKEKLLKTPEQKQGIWENIQQKMKEIEQKISSLDWTCKIKQNNNWLVKSSVLRQATYETCKYNYYLEYLKTYYSNTKNLVSGNLKEAEIETVQINAVVSKFEWKISEINQEIERAYKVFPIVYQAYADYENNISTHILLELIKKDYDLFRIWLHKSLHPINQVVYKISNAMKK